MPNKTIGAIFFAPDLNETVVPFQDKKGLKSNGLVKKLDIKNMKNKSALNAVVYENVGFIAWLNFILQNDSKQHVMVEWKTWVSKLLDANEVKIIILFIHFVLFFPQISKNKNIIACFTLFGNCRG